MRRRSSIVLLVGLGLAIVLLTRFDVLGVQVQPPSGPVVPTELVRPAMSGGKVVGNDLRRVWIRWYGQKREVIVRRSVRASTGDPWPPTQDQKLTCSFDITALVGRCGDGKLKAIYVAGTYDSGLSTVEAWVFGDSGGTGSVQRYPLYQGNSLGFISDITADDQRRHVYAVTYGQPAIYRFAATPGGLTANPSPLYDTTSIPALSGAKTLAFLLHATEGAKVVIGDQWPEQTWAPPDPKTVVLEDSENDGTIDDVVVLTDAEWEARGYDSPAAWVSFCVD